VIRTKLPPAPGRRSRTFRSPQGGPLGEPVGDPARRQTKRGQQHPQRLGRLDRLSTGGESVQVQIVLTIGKARGQPVRGVHRQSGLADAAHAVDRDERAVPGGLQQRRQLGAAPGEGGDVVR
jgi:hypothetical protein